MLNKKLRKVIFFIIISLFTLNSTSIGAANKESVSTYKIIIISGQISVVYTNCVIVHQTENSLVLAKNGKTISVTFRENTTIIKEQE